MPMLVSKRPKLNRIMHVMPTFVWLSEIDFDCEFCRYRIRKALV